MHANLALIMCASKCTWFNRITDITSKILWRSLFIQVHGSIFESKKHFRKYDWKKNCKFLGYFEGTQFYWGMLLQHLVEFTCLLRTDWSFGTIGQNIFHTKVICGLHGSTRNKSIGLYSQLPVLIFLRQSTCNLTGILVTDIRHLQTFFKERKKNKKKWWKARKALWTTKLSVSLSSLDTLQSNCIVEANR